MKSKRENFSVPSSLDSRKKINLKINQHIKGIIRQNKSVLSEKIGNNAQKIPQKIIFKTKQTHKYLYKKSLINNKFQWLNKYIQNSQLQSLSINIETNNLRHHKTDRLGDKENLEYHIVDQKKSIPNYNKRSKTQAIQQQQQQADFYQNKTNKNFFAQRKSQPEHQLKLLQQICLNGKVAIEKNLKLKRSKSLKDRKNIFQIANENLKQNLLKQRNISVSNRSNLMDKNFSISNETQGKQNITNHQIKNHKIMSVFIDENTPARQFLQTTSRLNSSKLMFKNTSGYIKNRKRQYIYQSKEQKRQQSELLKIKKRFQEQITVQPWNPNANFNENDENDFVM